MKKGNIIAWVGLLIVLILFSVSYYNNKTSEPFPKEQIPSKTEEVDNMSSSASAELIAKARQDGESMWLLFRSTTCIPCVEMQKLFDQLQPEYEDKVHFIAIDVNNRENMELLKNWKIQYIPTTFIVDSAGNVSYQNVGVIPTEDLKKELDKVVK